MQVVRLEPRTFMNGCQDSWLGIVLLLLLRLGLTTAHAAKKGDLLLHLLCHLLWSIEIYKIREYLSQNGQRNKISLCYINFQSYLSIKEPPNIWETLVEILKSAATQAEHLPLSCPREHRCLDTSESCPDHHFELRGGVGWLSYGSRSWCESPCCNRTSRLQKKTSFKMNSGKKQDSEDRTFRTT